MVVGVGVVVEEEAHDDRRREDRRRGNRRRDWCDTHKQLLVFDEQAKSDGRVVH